MYDIICSSMDDCLASSMAGPHRARVHYVFHGLHHGFVHSVHGRYHGVVYGHPSWHLPWKMPWRHQWGRAWHCPWCHPWPPSMASSIQDAMVSSMAPSMDNCLRIRCCREQTRCFRGAPRCRRGKRSKSCTHSSTNEPYLFVTGPHINIYHTRGRTLLSQAPHTNEPILCHERSPRTNVATCPCCTVDPIDSGRSRTPSRTTLLKNNDAYFHSRKPQIRNRRYPETSIKPPHTPNSPHIRC